MTNFTVVFSFSQMRQQFGTLKDEKREEKELENQAKVHSILRPSISSQDWCNSINKQRLASTGDWIREEATFKMWVCRDEPILWLFGIPGAGKSFTSSSIISFLTEQNSQDAQHPSHKSIAYFFLSRWRSAPHSIKLCTISSPPKSVKMVKSMPSTSKDVASRAWYDYERSQYVFRRFATFWKVSWPWSQRQESVEHSCRRGHRTSPRREPQQGFQGRLVEAAKGEVRVVMFRRRMSFAVHPHLFKAMNVSHDMGNSTLSPDFGKLHNYLVFPSSRQAPQLPHHEMEWQQSGAIVIRRVVAACKVAQETTGKHLTIILNFLKGVNPQSYLAEHLGWRPWQVK